MNSSMAEDGAVGVNAPHALRLRLADGLAIAVPPNLSAITTYVLLEQERWFEKEIDFLRCFFQPGMTAIDIGANLGVYSLPMARLVGPGGRVFSYEPGGEARALLEYSRALNDLGNLEIIGAAVSDAVGKGRLGFAGSSELRALVAGRGEPVRITSLDVDAAARGWSSPDFIKIDAEGEEERIIAGGRSFFATHSPLVMFEVVNEEKTNEALGSLFPTLGYRVFRQLAGAPVLVPHDPAQPLGKYELNLFAAKPDRVATLAQRGLLVEAVPAWTPGDNDRKKAIAFWQRQTFASLVTKGAVSGDADYQDGLAAYAVWRDTDQPVATRCGALAFAHARLREACAPGCTAERAATWARVAWEWGAREDSATALRLLLQSLPNTRVNFREPFWPAHPRFDAIAPGRRPEDWFAVAAAEQYERIINFSSIFGGTTPFFDRLHDHPLAGAEMERRRILVAARAGLRPKVPERLCGAAADHLNADVWKAGGVPGTVVGR